MVTAFGEQHTVQRAVRPPQNADLPTREIDGDDVAPFEVLKL
jgi:hypothetical protein